MVDPTTYRTIVGLLSTALLLVAPLGAAATLMEQVNEAAAHGEGVVQDTRADPPRAIANATNASWQGAQVNWTIEWSCSTVAVLNGDVEAALQERDVCPEADDAQTGVPEPEANADDGVAEAVPLGNETAIEDQVAAVEEAVVEILDDPSSVASTLQRLVNRTVQFVRHVLGLPGEAFDTIRDTLGDVADAVEDLGEAIGGAAVELTRTVGDALRDAGTTLSETGHDVWDGVAEQGRDTAEDLRQLALDILEMTKAPLRELGNSTGDIERVRPPREVRDLLDDLDLGGALP